MAARQGREYGLGVVAAAKWTAPALAEAAAEAIRRLPELQKRAAEAAPRFCRENCAEAFWDKLLGTVFPRGAASRSPAAGGHSWDGGGIPAGDSVRSCAG
jgi:hypothetical protein